MLTWTWRTASDGRSIGTARHTIQLSPTCTTNNGPEMYLYELQDNGGWEADLIDAYDRSYFGPFVGSVGDATRWANGIWHNS